MDTVVETITDLATSLGRARRLALPDPVRAAASRSLTDAVGVAIAAFDTEPVRLARAVMPRLHPDEPERARPIGYGRPVTTVEAAGFASTAMIRVLDFNDTIAGGHPSDTLGPLLALADARHLPGERVLAGLVASYEVFIRTTRAMGMRERGWDQAIMIGLATAAGACVLLDLDADRTRQAIAIAGVSSHALRNTRAGELSMWKGLATAHAARNGLFAARLAAAGVTGPEAPFAGRHGLMEQVTGDFELAPFPGAGGDYLTTQLRLKYWPVEYNLQAVVWATLELREKVTLEEVTAVAVETYWSCWHETASEPAKWAPTSTETADHSLPYVLAWAWHHGGLDLSAFQPEHFTDVRYRPLMERTTAAVANDIEAAFPRDVIVRVTVTTTKGASHRVEVRNPRGHEANPMSTAEVRDKFLRCAAPAIGAGAAESALDLLEDVRHLNDIATVLDAVVVPSGANPGERRITG